MGSDSLSKRSYENQPGCQKNQDDASKAEDMFIECLRVLLTGTKFIVIEQAKRKVHGNNFKEVSAIYLKEARIPLIGRYAVKPECIILNVENGKKVAFELKKQGDVGNAEERCFKHHVSTFRKYVNELWKMPQDNIPIRTIFCEKLATDKRYTSKYSFFFGSNAEYFLMVDFSNTNNFDTWLKNFVLNTLE